MRPIETASSLARFLLLLCVALTAGQARAVVVFLCADETTVTVPDPTGPAVIPMWGFGLDDPNTPAVCDGPVTVPGPAITVPDGDTDLVIHLRNYLGPTGTPGLAGTTALPKQVSLVIPGLEMPVSSPTCSAPVWTDGSSGARTSASQRVRSFGCEATPSTPRTYSWTAALNPIAPGNYLYESGTHPQVQVQMGLYGAVHRNRGATEAYLSTAGNDTHFDTSLGLLFSEIDPGLHAAVAAGTYGTASGPTSTLDYQPRYFLINGQPLDPNDPTPCLSGSFVEGTRIRMRMQNAGLRQLSPSLLSGHWRVVGEGGKALPFAHEQYHTLLMPGSTSDVIFSPPHAGRIWIIERGLSLTNSSGTRGGMQVCLDVGAAPNAAPTAAAGGPYTGTEGIPMAFDGTGSSDPEGQPLSYSWDFGDGNLGTGATPAHTFASDAGSPYTVKLTVSDGTNTPVLSMTTATVNANIAPTATTGGPYTARTGFPLDFDGTGSTDPELQPLSYSWTFGDSSSGDGATPSHTYATPGVKTVTLTVNDGFQNSVPAVTSATIVDNEPPVAVLPAPFSTGNPTVTISGCGSSDAEGDPLTYEWDFGDSESAMTAHPTCSVTHTYAALGTYTVTLVVKDAFGPSAPATTQVTIATPPNTPPFAMDDVFNPNEVYPSNNNPSVASIADPGVLLNDTDADGDPLTAALSSQSGQLEHFVLNPGGGFSWEPGEKVGEFPFTYTASDGTEGSNVAHVDVIREIWIKKAEFKSEIKQWRIEGKAFLPTNSVVTVYRGSTTGGLCIGGAKVSSAGVWKIQVTEGALTVNCPFPGTVPELPSGGPANRRVSADHLPSSTGCPTAPTCGAVLNAPLKVD